MGLEIEEDRVVTGVPASDREKGLIVLPWGKRLIQVASTGTTGSASRFRAWRAASRFSEGIG